MPVDPPVASPEPGITGQFEVVTQVLRVRSGDRLTVTKHVFTFRDGRLVGVSEPREEEAEVAEIPPPFAGD